MEIDFSPSSSHDFEIFIFPPRCHITFHISIFLLDVFHQIDKNSKSSPLLMVIIFFYPSQQFPLFVWNFSSPTSVSPNATFNYFTITQSRLPRFFPLLVIHNSSFSFRHLILRDISPCLSNFIILTVSLNAVRCF